MFKSIVSLLVAAAPLAQLGAAQEVYTDPDTGIVFNTWTGGDVTFGMSLPADALTTDATEFIGMVTCTSPAENTGYCGISLGGGMVNNLLLLTYPHEGQVFTSFRWADGYGPPGVYTGDATLTQISSSVTATEYSVLFRCENCLQWAQGASTGGVATSSGMAVLGWAHATDGPTGKECADTAGVGRHQTQGIMGAAFTEDGANEGYAEWAALATETVEGSC